MMDLSEYEMLIFLHKKWIEVRCGLFVIYEKLFTEFLHGWIYYGENKVERLIGR